MGSMIEDDDLPEQSDTEDTDGFLRQAKLWFRQDKAHSEDWRKEAKEDFEFRDGHQWSEDDKEKLRETDRPEVTFNRVLPTIKAVVGLEIGNRREVRFIPRTMGDARANEVLTAAAEWIRDECDAEDEETDAFSDTVTCGMGWTETRMDYEEDAEGRTLIERLDPLEMYWDSAARKRNLADARRLWRVRQIPLDEAKALIPGDFDDKDYDAAWARSDKDGEPNNADPENAYKGLDEKEGAKEDKEVTLVHLQWWEREPFYRAADPVSGQITEMDEVQHAEMKAKFPGVKSVKQMRRKYKQAFIGRVVLEMGPSPCDDHFSWECITGERDQVKGTFYGLVRSMKDPQRWANKWLVQTMHIMNSNPKGGVYAERTAFDNIVDAEKTIPRADKVTWVKDGALAAGRILPKAPIPLPPELGGLLEFAISSIRDVSGVNLELLGLKDTQQAGVLEEHRKQAGMTILATMFDALRRYRKRQGRILLYYIQNYMSDGRLIRIVGDEGEQYVPLVRQQGVETYDVIVDDSPTSPNQKERVWTIIMQLMPIFGPMLDGETLLTLLKYSPFPESVVQELSRQAKEKQEQNAPKQQEQEAIAKEAQVADIQKTISETEENKAQTAKIAQEAQAVPMRAMADAQATIIRASQPPVPRPGNLRIG